MEYLVRKSTAGRPWGRFLLSERRRGRCVTGHFYTAQQLTLRGRTDLVDHFLHITNLTYQVHIYQINIKGTVHPKIKILSFYSFSCWLKFVSRLINKSLGMRSNEHKWATEWDYQDLTSLQCLPGTWKWHYNNRELSWDWNCYFKHTLSDTVWAHSEVFSFKKAGNWRAYLD